MKKIGIFTADLMTPAGPSRAGCWMAERLSRRHEVWLISRDRPTMQSLGRSFGVSLANVRFLCLDAPGERRFSVWNGVKPFVPRQVWNIVAQFLAYRRLYNLKLDLFILNQSFHYMKPPAPRAIFMCMFPWPMPELPLARWCRLPMVKPLIDHALANTLTRFPYAPDTYDLITATSQFTASWIKRLWNKDAPVVYSATELMPSPPSGDKEKIILTVGRYNRDKQQHILIEAFREMEELHEAGWELHLVGQINPGESPRRYHNTLLESARGYPVIFHYDLSLDALRQLYGRSAIYWHAKGFGVPEDEPHRMEHFGITPLEAMSAGCVPVVMDAGGLRETVQHGVNGFRWRTLDEMRQQTLLLARNPELLAQFRARAVQVDPRFGVESFLEAIERIVEEVLAHDHWRILDIKGALRTTFEVRRVPYLPPDPKTGKVPLVKIEPQSEHPAVLTARPARVVSPEHRRIGPTNVFIPFPKAAIEQSIPARFEQQVAQYPTHIAIKTGPHILTYDALNRRANQLARAILQRQPAGNSPIALLLDHGAPTITALLAILKAGQIYIPLDPVAPQARLKALLEDTQAPLIIADSRYAPLAATLAPPGRQVLNSEQMETTLEDDNLGLPIAPEALAYILYTSGSTGQPKGVMQNHRNVLHNMMKYTNGSHICAEDRLSLLFSHSYSAAGTNIFGALLNGATLLPFHLQDRGLSGLATYLQEEGITVYHSVTTVFRHFVETLTGVEAFPHLRLIELTGEPVAWSDVEQYKQHFPPHCLLHNRLAATEMSLIRQYFVNHETSTTRGVVPVGYAVDDTEILLLDEDGNEVGCNCRGEMLIKSPYLAVGYWWQPELTRMAFLPDPVGGAARLYRTGDLGLLQPDGCLEHHGRKDFQVKIRGHRIEVGEVETTLLSLAVVKAAAVVTREDRPGDPHLVAYLVPATRPVPTVGSIRRALAATLPDYMIPAVFVWLEALPLMASGKVDRQALPTPGQVESTAETVVDGPRTPVEEIVAQIWSEVLSLERVSIYDHFFDLGGHSLLATQLLLRVHDRLQVEVPLRAFFVAPTVAAMAEIIVEQLLQHITPEALEQMLADTETPPSSS